jgi:hypothetical protein
MCAHDPPWFSNAKRLEFSSGVSSYLQVASACNDYDFNHSFIASPFRAIGALKLLP